MIGLNFKKMKKIYSKIDKDKVLHIIVRKDEMLPGREDIVTEENFIQCSRLNLTKGTTFKPHKHIWKERTRNVIAQESWVVIQGSVKCIFYDIDDSIVPHPTSFANPDTKQKLTVSAW